jgi:hypothetical protein
MRPRQRPHRTLLARAGSPRAKRAGLVLLGVLGLGGLGWAGVQGWEVARPTVIAWIEIRDVAVEGLDHVSRQDVLDRLALPANATLWSVSPAELAERLGAHPWIKHAVIQRRVPHGLDVIVVERKPAAILAGASQFWLVDDEGAVLESGEDPAQSDLPLLKGLDPDALRQGENPTRLAAQAGIRLAGMLDEEFHSRPEVDLSDPENVVAYVKGLRFQFGSSAFEEKWDRYRKIDGTVRDDAPGKPAEHPRDIDLRFSGKVIVQERG